MEQRKKDCKSRNTRKLPSLLERTTKKKKKSLHNSSSQARCPKEKNAKVKKVALDPAIVEKQEAKRVVNPLFDKRPKNFSKGQDIQL